MFNKYLLDETNYLLLSSLRNKSFTSITDFKEIENWVSTGYEGKWVYYSATWGGVSQMTVYPCLSSNILLLNACQ